MSAPSSSADLFTQVYSQKENTSSDGNAPIGGFLVCLDVPEATEFGIDYEVYRTGHKFQGVKFVPLGLHFVVFRAKDQEHGIRQGFFFRVEEHAQVVVREWSTKDEELKLPSSGLNVEHLEHAVRGFQLDDGLGAYPKQHFKSWRRLSKFISDPVLQRCGLSLGCLILPGDSESLSSLGDDNQGMVPYFSDASRTAVFTSLYKRKNDISVEARTQYHFDRSEMLEDLLRDTFNEDWREMMGEFQLAFILFLQLSSLAALEQWKQFIVLFCSCERALYRYNDLFVAFMKTLETHLEQIPTDFFQDELTSANFLRPCLSSLLELLDDPDIPQELSERSGHLRSLLHSRFQFTLEEEEDEFAPVVVPLEELEATTSSSTPGVDEEQLNAAIAADFLRSNRQS